MKNVTVKEYFTKWLKGESLSLVMCNGYRSKQDSFLVEITHVTEKGLMPLAGRLENGDIVINSDVMRDWDQQIMVAAVKQLYPKKKVIKFSGFDEKDAGLLTLDEAYEMSNNFNLM
jgi:hypothetical protein